ncbi:efflux RND transporter periplasmic adaptor subunit [Bowmanella sp. Y26]|uniref:efflux RND transporter periplasmic adaptor subunit n=1 Tax=Bowmanella yangjiangensis TaxID=2811230 RepID=UPI001BDDA640|nr:efflux RND transporter periplasmic adaptor subunit [Bowmanella yangjiangensis]MBT1065855.1 efflux RND transporter periplasmic adaptor subunit [Bowmanella yangjiangensis]
MRTLICLTSLLLVACSEESNQIPLYEAQRQTLSVIVPASGELFAAKSEALTAPAFRNGPQSLAWLAPEFSQVKKGDVIARFDGESLSVRAQQFEHKIALSNLDIHEKDAELTTEGEAIGQDIELVGEEKEFAEQFAIDDVQIRSKLEILESLQNKEYLTAKQGYLHWKDDSFKQSSAGELGLLSMQKSQHQQRLSSFTSSLELLEVRAPHDGTLVYYADWSGQKPSVGQTMWPGSKIATLPDLSLVKAKLFVLESEALDLAAGQSVSLYLVARPQTELLGEVEAVAPMPSSIRRNDPQKYYEVTVNLAKQDPELLVPGRKVEARINVLNQPDSLVVPLQSLFNQQNSYQVFRKEGSDFTAVPVQVGRTSLSHAQILSGLEEGDEVALINIEDKS